MRPIVILTVVGGMLGVWVVSASAVPFTFSTGNTDGRMAMASRPDNLGSGKIEIEAADDFLLSQQTHITSATFTGLLTNATVANINSVRVEIYRVFPADSNVGRTSGPPTFSTSQVPTRVNSPSDVVFDDRDSALGQLNFITATLSTFTASNSVQPGGIHPIPGQTTGGNGPATGQEVIFGVTFTTPFDLPADHYFFIPQVDVAGTGEFLWLSAPKPIVSPGTPFSPDLQAWIRDQNLDPDWLRVGTDIVGGGAQAPTFNGTFSLNGENIAVPEPVVLPSLGVLAGTAVVMARLIRNRRADSAD